MLTYADASQVDVMIMLATDRNVEQVLMELKEYAYAEVLYLLLYLLALLAALHVLVQLKEWPYCEAFDALFFFSKRARPLL